MSRMQSGVFVMAMAAAAMLAPRTVLAAEIERAMHAAFTPQVAGVDVVAVAVEQTFKGYAGKAGEPMFMVPKRIAFTPGQNYQPGDVTAVDVNGPLALTLSEPPAPAGAPLETQLFAPARDTRGDITLVYRAKVTPALSPRKPGPSYDLRGLDGGFAGAFFTFLLLPAAPAPMTASIEWKLQAFDGNAAAYTTRQGDTWHIAAPMELWNTFLLGGRVQSLVDDRAKFDSHWIGRPPFDAGATMQWSADAYADLRTYFRDPDSGRYTILMRPFPLPRDGGGASRGGFMLEYGAQPMTDASRRIMLHHEMIHHFLPSLNGDASLIAWFAEGLADFYKIKRLAQTGAIAKHDIAREIGVMTNAYYQNPFVSLPLAEAARLRWADRQIQTIPYNRGFMYFTDLNAKIAAKSAGKRSLDDLIHVMLERRRGGQTYDEPAWRALITAELGQQGARDLDAMYAGALIAPAANAFGACYARQTLDTARSELGFEENSLLVSPHVIQALKPESAAARAGVREGDAVSRFEGVHVRIAHSAPNTRLDPTVTLWVTRDGASTPISFSTQAETIREYRWELRNDAPAACSLP